MAQTGLIRGYQQIPNPQVLQPYDPGPRMSYFLRATPKISQVLRPGALNRNFIVTSSPAAEWPQLEIPASRRRLRGAGNQNPPGTVFPAGISSSETFGTAKINVLRTILGVQGISSLEAFGIPRFAGFIPPPQTSGEPGNVFLRDDVLTALWFREGLIYDAGGEARASPLYLVFISDD